MHPDQRPQRPRGAGTAEPLAETRAILLAARPPPGEIERQQRPDQRGEVAIGGERVHRPPLSALSRSAFLNPLPPGADPFSNPLPPGEGWVRADSVRSERGEDR